MKRAILAIREELRERIVWFEKNGKLLEAQRIKQRTEFDLEMMEEMGVCSGIENYSRHIAGRPPGSRPATVIDFFPNDYLLVIDESHATVPQIGAMFEGDRSRKTVLVEYGFRLPSALDNRPLKFRGISGDAKPDDLRQRHAGRAGTGMVAAECASKSLVAADVSPAQSSNECHVRACAHVGCYGTARRRRTRRAPDRID